MSMELQSLFESLDTFVNGLLSNGDQILSNPILWIVILVLIIGLFAIYDVPERTEQNSLGNIFRQLMQIILDTSGDLINAIRSITGFIGVVKLLLFGKIGPQTQFVLNNYAVIFLSMASFFTTFRGLSRIMSGVIAALVSFGIQVSILVLVTYLVILYGKGKKKSIMSRTYFENKAKAEKTEAETEAETETSTEYAVKKKKGKRKKQKPCEFKTIVTVILMACSIIASSSFSYLYIFEKLVLPGIALDDYTRSMDTVNQVAEEFSAGLKEYETELLRILQTYNDQVPIQLGFQDENPSLIQLELDTSKEEADQIEKQIIELQDEITRIENEGGDSQAAETRRRELSNQLREFVDEIETNERTIREDMNFQHKLSASQAIELLNNFYANPLYLNEKDGMDEDLNQAFGRLNQAVSLLDVNREFLTIDRQTTLTNIFNNYMTLSKYYAQNGKSGLDMTAVNEAAQAQGETLDTYAGMRGNGDTASIEAADNYLRGESNKVLSGILLTLSNTPQLESAADIWRQNNIVRAPEKSAYLKKVYSMYRDNSGQVDIMERAARKLFSIGEQYGLLSRMAMVLALFFDNCIVFLMLYRGRRQYSSNLSDYRQMSRLFFINPEIDKQMMDYKHGQKLATALGVISGVFLFVLYKGTSDSNSDFNANAISLLAFCIAASVIFTLFYKVYRRIVRKEGDWRDETIFQMWKRIWETNGLDEHSINIENLSEGNIIKKLNLTQENLQEMVGLLKKEETKREFLRYLYPDVVGVLASAEVKDLYMVLSKMKSKRKETKWLMKEYKQLPCVSEKSVKDHGLSVEFNILASRNIISTVKQSDHLCYVLPERFWMLLYNVILIRISGNSIISFNIEQELFDYSEEDENEI